MADVDVAPTFGAELKVCARACMHANHTTTRPRSWCANWQCDGSRTASNPPMPGRPTVYHGWRTYNSTTAREAQ